MTGPDPRRIFGELRRRRDPGIRTMDWVILECLAAGLGEEATAARVDRAAPTVRRRIGELKELLVGGLDVPPARELLVSWYHLHEDGRAREAA